MNISRRGTLFSAVGIEYTGTVANLSGQFPEFIKRSTNQAPAGEFTSQPGKT